MGGTIHLVDEPVGDRPVVDRASGGDDVLTGVPAVAMGTAGSGEAAAKFFMPSMSLARISSSRRSPHTAAIRAQ